jgi:predicted peptidase
MVISCSLYHQNAGDFLGPIDPEMPSRKSGDEIMRICIFRIGLGFLLFALYLQAQDSKPFLEKNFSKKICYDFSLRYLIFLPAGYNDSQEKWPLILYLHGGMGRGNDFKKLYWYPVPKMILENKHKLPFIVVIPQCPEGKMWSDMELLKVVEILKNTIESYRVDSTRVYAIGYSMGGNGVMALAYYASDIFAAIAPMSGMSNTWWASKIKDIPSWFFHGAKDDHVPVRESDEMVDALKKEGAEVRYSRNNERTHSPPTENEHLELFEWLLKHKKSHSVKASKITS